MPKKRSRQVLQNDEGYPYSPCILVEGKRMYLDYYVYEHASGEMKRRRFFANDKSKSREENRKYLLQQKIALDALLKKGYSLDEAPKTIGESHMSVWEAVKFAANIKIANGEEATKVSYKSRLKYFRIFLEERNFLGIPVHKFSKKHCYEYIDWLRDVRGVGPRTINNYMEFVHGTFNLLVEREYLKKSPAKGIRKMKVTSTRHVPYEKEEKELIENYLRENNFNLYLFTRFIYYAFMRPEDVCRVQVADIKLDRKIIVIYGDNTKNDQQAPAVINPPFMEILQSLDLEQYPKNYYLFSSIKEGFEPGERKRFRNRFSEAYTKVLKHLELYDGQRTLYSWKHTGNVAAYMSGLDIYSIMRQNRHAKLETTLNYLRGLSLITPEDLKEKSW
ncbi:MAG: phage integrase SAM-like domain-containing protein [Bacteroidia bacterium]|nr:phage integrase SAM-like domain-containing protein [Bacteroidia bacterium]